jgi:hypothetical protein
MWDQDPDCTNNDQRKAHMTTSIRWNLPMNEPPLLLNDSLHLYICLFFRDDASIGVFFAHHPQRCLHLIYFPRVSTAFVRAVSMCRTAAPLTSSTLLSDFVQEVVRVSMKLASVRWHCSGRTCGSSSPDLNLAADL